MNVARPRVLIADCHEDTLIALQKALEDAGFDTTTVWTAQEFLNALRSQVFDLVLVNDYVPGARCEELLYKLRDMRMRCILIQAQEPTPGQIAALEGAGTFEAVRKHDYPEIVRLVRQILGADKKIPAA
jgi:DNA-binding NtrC family response regulator